MKRKEFIIVFSLFLFGIILLIFQEKSSLLLYLIVEVNNKEVLRVNLKSLKSKREFPVEGSLGKSHFEYNPEKGIRMISSPCPDKICIKQGWINKKGESIVCLPNRVVLRLEDR